MSTSPTPYSHTMNSYMGDVLITNERGTRRELNSKLIKMTVWNSNYIVIGIDGNHKIENPDPTLFKNWSVAYNEVFTDILCFVDPKIPKAPDVLFDLLRLMFGDV
jgi:hypothetical protein